MGLLVYNVLEADWKAALTDGGRAPKHRFLFIRLSMTNSGGEPVSVPALELQATDGTRYQEVTEQMGAVPNWLGLLRTLRPAEARQGVIVFDAPMAAYKLVLTDAGEVGSEKFALVEIPVLLE